MEDDPWVTTAGVLVLLAGAALAAARFWGEPPPARGLECAVGAIAFGAVAAAPGVLALLARRDRPTLVLPAAVLLVPMSFISFALVTLPLLIPAFMLLRSYRRTGGGGAVRAAMTTVAVLALLVAAVMALFANDDAREWATPRTVYGTSDVVTYAEAAVAVGLAAAAVAGGWWATRPGQPDGMPQITDR